MAPLGQQVKRSLPVTPQLPNKTPNKSLSVPTNRGRLVVPSVVSPSNRNRSHVVIVPGTTDWPGGSYMAKLPQSFLAIVVGTFVPDRCVPPG